jgi:hypothetical protein
MSIIDPSLPVGLGAAWDRFLPWDTEGTATYSIVCRSGWHPPRGLSGNKRHRTIVTGRAWAFTIPKLWVFHQSLENSMGEPCLLATKASLLPFGNTMRDWKNSSFELAKHTQTPKILHNPGNVHMQDLNLQTSLRPAVMYTPTTYQDLHIYCTNQTRVGVQRDSVSEALGMKHLFAQFGLTLMSTCLG